VLSTTVENRNELTFIIADDSRCLTSSEKQGRSLALKSQQLCIIRYLRDTRKP